MFHLEKSIKKWVRSFQKQRAFDDGTIHEMELHLRDHIDDLLSEGLTERKAFERAVKSFGDIKPVAEEQYSNIKRQTTIRSLLFRAMLQNYFKTTLRSMMKNPLSSFINVFGLAVAIGVSIVVYATLDFDYRIDRHHINENEIYLTTFYIDRDGEEKHYGLSPAPLGKMMEQDYSSISSICRLKDGNAIVKNGDDVFNESIRAVDPTFLDFFTFPLRLGDPKSLKGVSNIVLSDHMATKYFGDADPIGQQLLVKFNEKLSKSFTVTGVAEEFPATRAVDFDFLINLENYQNFDQSFDFSNWSDFVGATLIMVPESANVPEIAKGMKKYIGLQNQKERDWAISKSELIKFKDLHFRSREINKDISNDRFYLGRMTLPFVALFLIFLACFNYINIAIVSAAKRLKEIGIRKVIGANRSKVIAQFLTENIALTLFALVIGIILAFTLMLPWFNNLSNWGLSLSVLDYKLWLFLAGLLIFTGLVSGIYPAFYISKFPVVTIFKGSTKFGKKNVLTKVFLAIQIIFSCLGVTIAVMYAQNSDYMNRKSWGYDQHGALYLFVPNATGYRQLEAALIKDPNVKMLAGSSHHLGKSRELQIVRDEQREYEVSGLAVDHNYFETLGLEILSGEGFNESVNGDQHAILVNELFVKNLGLEDPLDHQITIDSTYYTIKGVVKNFHFNNFYYENEPTIFSKAAKDNYRYLSLRAFPGKENEVLENIRAEWAVAFPETPFRGGHQEDVWGGFYDDLDIQEVFMRNIAYIFVILTALGLYGLVTLNVAGRIREFSIRKTLGAGTKHIAYGVIKQYLLLSGIALTVGAPISFFLAKANIKMMYPEPRPFGADSVLIAAILLATVLFSVLLMQVRKVLKANPVDGLKTE